MPKIEILSGKREGDTVELSPEGLDIGNRKSAALSIRDPWISWNHAKIVFENNRYVIEDLGSSNGTWLNGQKITRHQLAPNEEIVLGKTKIRFIDAAPPEPEPVDDAELGAPTIRIDRKLLAADAKGDRLLALEREVDELRHMKDVLERFLEVNPDERASIAQQSKDRDRVRELEKKVEELESTPRGPDPAELAALEKGRQEAIAKAAELEGKLLAAEAKATDLDAKLKSQGEQSKKAAKKLEEELAAARSLQQSAEQRVQELVAKAGGDAGELDKLRVEVDKAKAETGRVSKERDEWKARAQDTREEIDRISMEQIELEDELRKRISELEDELGKKV